MKRMTNLDPRDELLLLYIGGVLWVLLLVIVADAVA